jgi:NADH-quinone oxidoreductase subunit J
MVNSSSFFILNIILLSLMVGFSIWAVITRTLMRSALGLAVVSVLLTLVMFRFNSPLAAVFELSVCAGLITVVFISAISLTKPLTQQELLVATKERIRRYWYLPLIVIVSGLSLLFSKADLGIHIFPAAVEPGVQEVLWNGRPTDVLGQIIIILVGVFGVVVLFKERRHGK